MRSDIRPKRRGQAIYRWTERLHVSMTVETKGQLLGVARENYTTISALGYAMVKVALEQPAILDAALELLTKLEEQAASGLHTQELRRAA